MACSCTPHRPFWYSGLAALLFGPQIAVQALPALGWGSIAAANPLSYLVEAMRTPNAGGVALMLGWALLALLTARIALGRGEYLSSER
ncbi:hypothetical protein [Mycetocola tolaasinivorans]|uniref:hypothetical protein n=1 Tax=Mycetocola tolaasinivorans TaxID=76635 RepID=UPI0011C37B3F|nr:hypothetical protein [Mycetocola tolaasinivorans]